MLNRQHQWYIDRRISCYEGGYPDSEARFLSVEEYAEHLENKRDAAKMSLRHVCPVCDAAFADDKLHDAIVRAERECQRAETASTNAAHERERAERAEAEIEQMQRTLSDHLESESAETMRADRAEAERDALRALLAETIADRDQMKYVFGTDLLGRIDAKLREGGK